MTLSFFLWKEVWTPSNKISLLSPFQVLRWVKWNEIHDPSFQYGKASKNTLSSLSQGHWEGNRSELTWPWPYRRHTHSLWQGQVTWENYPIWRGRNGVDKAFDVGDKKSKGVWAGKPQACLKTVSHLLCGGQSVGDWLDHSQEASMEGPGLTQILHIQAEGLWWPGTCSKSVHSESHTKLVKELWGPTNIVMEVLSTSGVPEPLKLSNHYWAPIVNPVMLLGVVVRLTS